MSLFRESGLGEKFGGFTEGLALPSMERLLRQRFGMKVVSPSLRVTKDGRHLEIDVLSYANGALEQAYLVEVKSHLRRTHPGSGLRAGRARGFSAAGLLNQ